MKTIALIQKLMSFRSVTADYSEVNRCSDFVAAYLRKNKVSVEVVQVDGRRIVYAATHAGRTSDVLLNTHLDVVSAPASLFRPVVKGKRLIGRGASDCKGTAAVVMNLLIRLNGKVKMGAFFSVDEEEGGRLTQVMVEKGFTGRFVLVLDGDMNRLTLAQKGILCVKVHAAGRACHSAAPWRGGNAIDKLMAAREKLKVCFPIRVTEKNNWHDTCAVTLIEGGTVRNMVPAMASMTLNIRFTEKSRVDILLRKIRKATGCRVEKLFVTPFVSVSEKDPTIRRFYHAMRRNLSPKVVLSRMNGATDARYFVKSTRSIAITGLSGGGAHSTQEWLDLNSVPIFEDFLYHYLLSDSPKDDQ